jgi:hypothetical protein
MESKEQCYYVTVKKSVNICYQVYAYSFEDALKNWEEHGDEVDVDPNGSIVLSIRLDEES